MIPIVQAIAGVTIWINGVELTGDKSNAKFGQLHMGDVITLFRPLFYWSTHSLVFKCEFFVGPDARPRAMAFVVKEFSFCHDSDMRNLGS